jgi:hypothetical protein
VVRRVVATVATSVETDARWSARAAAGIIRGIADAAPSPPDSLRIRVLGELAVCHGETPVGLPRSRKARALLAYLAITGRSHRREQLSDLLWDVTDDRRAALRWALSKLRQVLGPSADDHLVATRERIELALPKGALDLGRLRRACRGDALELDALEPELRAWNGELLEGMLLPDFDAFEAWLEAERAEVRAMHLQFRRLIVARLAGDPIRALVHARAWVLAGGGAEARDAVERLSATAPSTPVVDTPPKDSAPAIGPSQPPLEPSLPLVGRDRPLARLRRIVAETRAQRRAHVVLVIGEPGMGKTRLLEELRFRERDPAPAVLEATFHEVERGRPLGPFLDATRGLLPDGHQAAERGTADREHLFEAIAGLLRRGAEARGLALLVLDDAHLADLSSAELLHFTVRTSMRAPLLTVLACRPAELQENVELGRTLAALRRHHPVEEIVLGPLDADAMRMLVEVAAPGRAPDAILRDSAGVPLVALELSRCAPDTDAVPRSLSDLVVGRLAALPEAAQALVRWAAVIEQGLLEILQKASSTEVPQFAAALDVAERYRFVRLDPSFEGRGTFRMDHALVSRVVYESTSAVRRAAMHRVIAEIMSEGDVTADDSACIAHHASRADRPDLAAQALVRAATRAAVLGASREASDLTDRALSIVSGLDPTTSRALEIEARCLLLQLRRPDAPGEWVARLTTLGLDAAGQGDAEVASRAFHAAGRLRWETGNAQGGIGIARQALRATTGAQTAQRVRGHSMVALCLALMEKDLADAQAMIHEAEALSRAEARGDEPSELAFARALLHQHAGRLDDARSDAADARVLARVEQSTVREAASVQLMMQIELLAGDPLAVQTCARELGLLAARIREGCEGDMAAAGLALVDPTLDDARTSLQAIVQRLRLLDDKRAIAWALNRWAARERDEGSPASALELAREALRAALAVEAYSEAAIAACGVMLAATMLDDDDAFVEAERALADIEARGTLSMEARRMIRAAADGNPREAPLDTEATTWRS